MENGYATDVVQHNGAMVPKHEVLKNNIQRVLSSSNNQEMEDRKHANPDQSPNQMDFLSPQQERQIIKEIITEHKMKLGQPFFLLSSKWWSLWKEYVRYDEPINPNNKNNNISNHLHSNIHPSNISTNSSSSRIRGKQEDETSQTEQQPTTSNYQNNIPSSSGSTTLSIPAPKPFHPLSPRPDEIDNTDLVELVPLQNDNKENPNDTHTSTTTNNNIPNNTNNNSNDMQRSTIDSNSNKRKQNSDSESDFESDEDESEANYRVELKKGLKLKYDYELVPQDAWNYLQEWYAIGMKYSYSDGSIILFLFFFSLLTALRLLLVLPCRYGGGPELCREVIYVGLSMNHQVELYPLYLRIQR